MEVGQSMGICTREISVCCFRATALCNGGVWLGQVLWSAESPAHPLHSAVGSPGISLQSLHWVMIGSF